MSTRVSKVQIETQGRGKYVVPEEQKAQQQTSDSRSYKEAYRALLAKELLFNSFQDNYSKYF
jgi:predicted RNA-binding protein YlxR (DUF448 family)